MGRRKGFKTSKNKVNALPNAASSDDDDIEALLDDEIDKYNAARNEEGAKNVTSKKLSKKSPLSLEDDEMEDDDEMGLDEEDEDDESMDSDDEDNDDDIFKADEKGGKIPDARAWGKKTRLYHNTDYVDKDFGDFEGSDAEMAEQEENEAKEIQKRLMAELDESDFLDFLPTVEVKESESLEKTKEIIKIDVSNLSSDEKLKLLQRECPEVIGLLKEYKDKLNQAKEIIPLKEKETSDVIKKFYDTKYQLILNYCTNISYFLYLRTTNPTDSKSHPVLKKIMRYKKLLEELCQFKPEKFKVKEAVHKKKAINIRKVVDEISQIEKRKKLMLAAANKDSSDSEEEMKVEELEAPAHEKRKITYQIAKNKGLTPKRKKEQKNPRVKHREKFRKAKIRRKGQVRSARSEVQRYGGETSGIKAHLTKSVKLK